MEPLKSAAPEGLGPLALHNIGHKLLGAAFVYGSEKPDLFVAGQGGAEKLYLCKWLRDTVDGVPVFAPPVPVKSAFTDKGALTQTADGAVHAFWISKGELIRTIFDRNRLAFEESGRVRLTGLPKSPASLAILPKTDGSIDLVFEIPDDSPGKDGDPWTEEWRPYDAAGIWTGGFPYRYLYGARLPALFRGPLSDVRQVSPAKREVYFGMYQLAPVNLGKGRARDLIVGARLGTFVYFHNRSPDGLDLQKGQLIADEAGQTLRNSNAAAGVIAYPPAPGRELSNLIAGGEGALSFYRFTGNFTKSGRPMFKDQTRVLQTQADLYAGSLPVPTVIDWNGDGVLDIVSGNSEGFVLFFRNAGTNENSQFLPGVPIEADGRPIHVQAGYSGSVQGVQEALWGYTSPNAVDWNGDGLPDIVMGDITGNFTVYLNKGTPGNPQLDPPQPIYCDGLTLHGMWRVRPAVAQLGERRALLIVDGEDHFHLYWQIDDYHVEDGGKLRLKDGSLISASSGPGGLTGRCKLDFFDWDQDGKLDLIIGTCRSNAIPNKQSGYPRPTLGEKPRATVLFMRNVGTDAEPVFEHPVPFVHSGTGIVQLGGAHESGAVGTVLGKDGPNLLAGNEAGRLFLLSGKKLTPRSGN